MERGDKTPIVAAFIAASATILAALIALYGTKSNVVDSANKDVPVSKPSKSAHEQEMVNNRQESAFDKRWKDSVWEKWYTVSHDKCLLSIKISSQGWGEQKSLGEIHYSQFGVEANCYTSYRVEFTPTDNPGVISFHYSQAGLPTNPKVCTEWTGVLKSVGSGHLRTADFWNAHATGENFVTLAHDIERQ